MARSRAASRTASHGAIRRTPARGIIPTSLSQAGFLDIEPASPIICAHATRNGVIFFTAKKAYNSQFLGLPYIYNYVELGNNCTPWSPQSISGTVSMTVWMSKQGLFAFDGTSITPMNCMVRPWVDDDIDLLEVREQACMVHVGDFSEVWWFFPQNGLTKNSRCIIYSYKEGWWGMGRMARTAGITSSYTAHTIMADDTVAYQHEVPNAYPIDVPLPWAETFDLNLNSGSKLTTLKQLMPDIDGDPTNLLYSVFYRNSRSAGAPELQTAPQQVRSNGYVDFRVTARDIRLRIEVGAPPGQPRPGVTHVVGRSAPGGFGRAGGSLMATPTPTPRTVQPPPDLPNDPKTSDVLSNYLRSFSLWCRHGFADKLSVTTAAPGLMLQATDDPTKIFMIQVNSAGTITATAVALGGGKP